MSKRIFKTIFFTAIAVVIGAMLFITGLLYYLYSNVALENLKQEINYIKVGIDETGLDYLDNVNGNLRISIIQPDGIVIYDSEQETEALSNHLDREEVLQAIKNGNGEAIRYSDTLGEKMIYASSTLKNGNILRIAQEQLSFLQILRELLQTYLIVILLALVVSAIVSKYLSSRLLRPIINIDLENPQQLIEYPEIDPLISKINAQRAEIIEQLKSAEKQQRDFESLIRNMQEGLILTDEKGNILSFNQPVLDYLDCSIQKGTDVRKIKEDRDFVNLVDKALTENSKESIDLTIDGRVISIRMTPVRMESIDENGLVILMIDITEKAKRERLRREYISDISHELKTPLMSIMGYAELIHNGIASENDIPHFTERIYKEAEQLRDTVNDLKTISALDEVDAIILEPVNLARLTRNVVDRLSDKAHAADVSINVEIEPELRDVDGNIQILSQLIFNLIDNAIKYNHRGGQVTVRLNQVESKVYLCVQDTGCGISPSEQERIFERFYRSDKSRSKEIEGSGLGLAIVKHAATYHNAKIDLKSTLDVGTEITIIFS